MGALGRRGARYKAGLLSEITAWTVLVHLESASRVEQTMRLRAMK